MLKIYADKWLLHDDRLTELKVIMPKLTLEVNKTGSLVFSIYPEHPYYGNISKFKSIITVYQDNLLLFRGRVLEDNIGFYNEKQVVCEGQLAFLLDSIQRPYDYTGSIVDYLKMLIANHNQQVEVVKQFTVGNVTVTDPNNYIVRSNINYVSTWEEINKKLIDNLGGIITVRFEQGTAFIDYLNDSTTLSNQTVEFGKNLLDLKRIRKGDSIATAIIPLGAKLKDADGQDTDIRLDIKSVNNNVDYVFDQVAVDKYGWIFTTETWDDVTDANNLLTKGKAHLASLVNAVDLIELTAADLAKIDLAVNAFHVGTKVRVISKPHNIDQIFLVRKLDIALLDPAANKLILGGTFQGFGEALQGLSEHQGDIVQTIEKVAENASNAVFNTEQNLQASINVAAQNIEQTVTESTYLKTETDSLIAEVSSKLEQTALGWEMQFTDFNKTVTDLSAGTDAEFDLIRKYIRFLNGTILLGQAGNLLELEISNDRISFKQGGAEVAYFSNNKLYVTDAHFLHSLQLGQFAYMPRANGNLSFKKVVK